MNQEQERSRIAVASLNHAHYYLNQNDYGNACAYYLLHLEMSPTKLRERRDKFVDILHKWAKTLDEDSRRREVITVYTHALRYYPDDLEVLSSLGVYCVKYRYFGEAKIFLTKAYELDKDHIRSQRNLYAWKEVVFERWHYKMLNDKARNSAYKKAIYQTLDRFQSDVIYDIGSGCGLMSLYAAQHPHSTKIIAVEEQEIQFETAKEVIKLNRGAEKIVQMNLNSSDIKSGEVEKGSMLITEIFDTGFFGEHVMPTLIHAWENLLEENAAVIPCRADVYICGINCEELMREHMILVNNPLLGGKGSVCCMTQKLREPYAAEYLTQYKDVKYLTRPAKISVNLSNLDELKRLYSNMGNAYEELELIVLESGILHAFVVWFDLFLTEDIRVTTNPASNDCLNCWEQAIAHVEKPIEVKKDQSLNIQRSCHLSKLDLDIPEGYYEGTPVTYYRLVDLQVPFLNDEAIHSNLELVLKKLKATPEYVIADLTITPLLGIIANRLISAECFIICYEDKSVVEKLCELNNIDISKINICDESSIDRLLVLDETMDLLVLDPIAHRGIINVNQLYKYKELKRCLKPNGLIIPQKVTLFVELIESERYEDLYIVEESNLCGVIGADILNEFRVPEICEIDSKKCDFKKLSDPVETVNIICDCEQELVTYHEIDVTCEGDAIGVLYWFQIDYLEDIAFNTVDSSYYKEAMILFDKKLHVSPGNKLKIRIKRYQGLLGIYLDG